MTLLIRDDLYFKHTQKAHPECAERLEALEGHLRKTDLWDQLTHLPARDATNEELGLVHGEMQIGMIQAPSEYPRWIDGDTYMNEHSVAASVRAAGGVLAAVDEVEKGKDRTAFCMVRPPGHHATPVRSMGFCLFNNVAIAARYLKKKVLILDWDVHHGNGTQDTFWDDPSVFYLSFHRWPFYPGTGRASDRGKHDNIRNRPFDGGISSAEYIRDFRRTVKECFGSFQPEFVILSSGFDAYIEDPVGGLGLEPADFGTLTRIVREQTEAPIVSVLEGGYSLTGLGPCAEEHLRALME